MSKDADSDVWVGRAKAVGNLGIGVICALSLAYGVVVLGDKLTDILERLTVALEIMADTYTGR